MRLVDIIGPQIKQFIAHDPPNSVWGENQLGESFYQFYEDTQLKWGQLENWQDTKNYLVERTMEWMTEFTPTLEEQIVDNTFS